MTSSLTIAERIRLESASSSSATTQGAEDTSGERGKSKSKKASGLLSIDEQIAALEAGNALSSSDSESGSDTDSSSGGRVRRLKAAQALAETDDSGRVVKLVSSLASERIIPLSRTYLPTAACGAQSLKPGQKLKDSDEIAREKKEKADKKRARIEAEERDGTEDSRKKKKRGDAEAAAEKEKTSHQSGLEATVREMLRNYQPASMEKRPFWCRICRHQAEDQKGMIAHRKSDDHATAAKIEAKMSHCNLCHKQFTSPAQLKEHLNAKAHKERLEKVKRSQSGPTYS